MWTVVNKEKFDDLMAKFDKNLLGSGNTAPSGFREITEKEFCQEHYYTDYSTIAEGYLRIHELQDGTKLPKMISAHLYLNPFGHGWAMYRDYHEGKVHYYLFELCKHEYETTKRARSYWEGKCKKCGQLHSVDSSD